MRAKNLALRVLSTAAMLSIVTSIAAPAFAATYYINDGSVDVTVSETGEVTVNQGNKTYTDSLDSVVIRGGTRGDKGDDRTEVGASPATQEADGSNAPAVNETEAPKSENTAGDTAPKPVTTAAGERKEGTPQQEPTEEEEEEEEQQEQQEPTEEKVTPEPAKAKTEAPKATQKPSAEQEEEKQEKEEQQEEEEEEEKKSTDSSVAPLTAAPAAQADNSSTSTPAERTDNVITIVNNFVNDAKKAFSFVLDNVNIDRSEEEYGYEEDHKAALTVKGKGDTEIELDGNNILKGGYGHAGLEKNDSDGTGTLTIKDDNKAADGSQASLFAKGKEKGAGIGGGECQDTSHITVTGGKITAVSGRFAAGIGGGGSSDGTDIIIKGDATVTAIGDAGAGIGGGGDGGKYTKGYGKVTITDQANVTAWSEYGAGIGGGRNAGGDITISGDATVAAEAHNGSIAIGSGGWLISTSGNSDERLNTKITICDRANVTAVGTGLRPAIGSLGYFYSHGGDSYPFTTINILGGTLNVINEGDDQYTSDIPAIGSGSAGGHADLVLNINASTGNTVINAYTTGSNAATIGKGQDLIKDDEQIQYNADGSSKFGEAGSVILHLFKKATTDESNQIEDWGGAKHTLHKIHSGELYDTLHNAQWWMKNNGYTSELTTDTNHAWKVDKRVEPTPDQEGHVYYKCSVPGCKAVHDEVLPKLEESKPTPKPTPDPTPVQPEPTPVPTPDPAPVQPDTPADTQNTAKDDVSTPKLYVIDLASTQVLFDETRQDDTVTYTTKQDGASLTGSFEALEAMAEDGVKTIVFQTIGTNTPGAVSRVSVDALLQHGGETLLLTHNGTEVHLTIDGQNADSLLQ